jgi:hypothetical protein
MALCWHARLVAVMSAHTPGPWSIEHKDHAARQIITSKKGAIAILQSYGSAEATAAAPLIVERMANARLIAAAPELLKAAQLLAAWDQSDGDVELISEACSVARQAIAKATE